MKNIFIGIAAGVLYGLFLRVGFEWKVLHEWFQIISASFLICAPFGVGALAVFVSSLNAPLTVGRQIAVSSLAMLCFLFAMFALWLEGFICIVLVVPVFFVAAIIGGLVTGLIVKYFKKPKSTVYGIALLPLMLNPFEALLPHAVDTRIVTTSIIVAAPAEVVFDQLASVREIQPNELGTAFVHTIGLPRPVEATMQGRGVGAVRTSRWERGVSFKEEITEWQRPQSLRYKFIIEANSIPADALDRHVELGGEYFTVVDGGYKVKFLGDGKTKLTLSTRYQNKSHLKLFGNLWGDFVLNDFHYSILGLMKNRSEKAHSSTPGEPRMAWLKDKT